jgi:hypothetical protein
VSSSEIERLDGAWLTAAEVANWVIWAIFAAELALSSSWWLNESGRHFERTG